MRQMDCALCRMGTLPSLWLLLAARWPMGAAATVERRWVGWQPLWAGVCAWRLLLSGGLVAEPLRGGWETAQKRAD